MKRLIALAVALMLVLGMTVTAEGKPELGGSYYNYSFNAEGYGTMQYYIHFYEEVPVLGAVYYINYMATQTVFAGTYKVYQASYEYSCYENRAAREKDEPMLIGTAPYTVVFCDFAGNVIDGCGWDGEGVLYNDMEVLTAMAAGPMLYHLDADPADADFADAYDKELGVTYLEFMGDEDETCTVQLCHNMSYVDMMVMLVEGSWSMQENEQGGFDYILTPDDPADTPAALSVSADGLTAVYTTEDGDVYNMHNTAEAEVAVQYAFAGTFPTAYGVNGDLTINLLEDGTCTLIVGVFGQEAQLDAGTWSVTPGYAFTVTLETLGEFVSSIDMSTYAITLPVSADIEGMGKVETELAIVK